MRLRTGLEPVFVDTNVLVYVFDPEAMANQTCARNLVIHHLGSGTLALSTQVLPEFYWTVTRKPEVPLPIWDALILETAESCGASVLYTEDKHLLSTSSGIEIVDPFAGLGEQATD